MKYDSAKHDRGSIRLKGYDYRQVGAYFVMICTQNRKCLFGDIVHDDMRLNYAGSMVKAVWCGLTVQYPDVELDTFVIMPNHVHAVIVLVGAGLRACPDRGQPQGIAPTLSLPDVVHRFETFTTKRYADGVKELGWPSFAGRLWQRNYFEHVIRNEESLNRIREYIMDNPARWAMDRENPDATRPRAGERVASLTFFAPLRLPEPKDRVSGGEAIPAISNYV